MSRSTPGTPSGLEEILSEISPIRDFSDTMSLEFREPKLMDPPHSIEECKDKDMTYSRAAVRHRRVHQQRDRRDQEPDGLHGRLPAHDQPGHLHHQRHRARRRLPARPFARASTSTAPWTRSTDREVYAAKVIPGRGAWLEFEVDKRDQVGVRIDRKRRQPVTVLLRALGWDNEKILERFGEFDSMRLTLEKDHTTTPDEALIDIYRKLRPGEPPTRDAAETLLNNLYFNEKRYDLAKVGRYKVNKKLGIDVAQSTGVLTEADIVAAIDYVVRLHRGDDGFETDDIDHFGNRRLRTVGELIQNQVRIGLSRMERVVRERMTTQDVEAITPQTLINIRPVVASIKEFFGTSQLSQFMDQTNPLAGLTHKRRLSALGPGGLSRERAGFEVRDVHPSHYGRMCPIETPEGPNIGLIGSLSTYARVNPFGFVETPYRRVDKGRVTDHIDYLTADEEDRHVIAQANAPLNAERHLRREPRAGPPQGRRGRLRRARPPSTTWTSRRARWCRSRPR